ncbi:acyl-CoA hydrolase [Chryseobacterium sp. H1D6B]|nr:acyl-CoA hydrolase [Chryseobacterium sp. H1D6B]
MSFKIASMNYHTRKWVKPEDLNPNHSLFGGRLLQWIDEEAALYAIIQLENTKVVTKFISEINFVSSAKQGDIVEIGIEVSAFGSTSITLKCEVRNKMTHQTIITVDKIVMVNLGEDGNPAAHGKTQVEFVIDRLNSQS